jgi:hypothetical protein
MAAAAEKNKFPLQVRPQPEWKLLGMAWNYLLVMAMGRLQPRAPDQALRHFD